MDSSAPTVVKLLVADDEPALREMLGILFRREGYQVIDAPGCKVALEAIGQAPQAFPVVLTDLAMPDGSGLDVLAGAKARCASTEVILFTAHHSVENAIDAMSAGAFNFVTKPFDPAELTALVRKALEKHVLVEENSRLKAQMLHRADTGIIGKSRSMRSVIEIIERIAPARTTVLITGES